MFVAIGEGVGFGARDVVEDSFYRLPVSFTRVAEELREC